MRNISQDAEEGKERAAGRRSNMFEAGEGRDWGKLNKWKDGVGVKLEWESMKRGHCEV